MTKDTLKIKYPCKGNFKMICERLNLISEKKYFKINICLDDFVICIAYELLKNVKIKINLINYPFECCLPP